MHDDEKEAERRAKKAAYMREYYRRNAKYREDSKARAREWDKKFKGKKNARAVKAYSHKKSTLTEEQWLEYRAKRSASTRKWQAKNKEWQAEYAKQRRKERYDLAWSIKAERGCGECGERDPRCLDFHHRDKDSKVADVANMMGHNMETLRAEMEKCDVVCANCHRKHHDGNREIGGYRRQKAS